MLYSALDQSSCSAHCSAASSASNASNARPSSAVSPLFRAPHGEALLAHAACPPSSPRSSVALLVGLDLGRSGVVAPIHAACLPVTRDSAIASSSSSGRGRPLMRQIRQYATTRLRLSRQLALTARLAARTSSGSTSMRRRGARFAVTSPPHSLSSGVACSHVATCSPENPYYPPRECVFAADRGTAVLTWLQRGKWLARVRPHGFCRFCLWCRPACRSLSSSSRIPCHPFRGVPVAGRTGLSDTPPGPARRP